MKSFAYPLAILIVAAAGIASAASPGAAEELGVTAPRLESDMTEKKKLRAPDKHLEAPAGAQPLQFEIQTGTSELQNAESVGPTTKAKPPRVLSAPNGAPSAGAQSAPGTLIGSGIGGHANDGDE